jgi:DUF1680 family protein
VEADDLPKDAKLSRLALEPQTALAQAKANRATIASSKLVTITVPGRERIQSAWTPDELYREIGAESWRDLNITFVPYYAWGNRGDSDMSVWIPLR